MVIGCGLRVELGESDDDSNLGLLWTLKDGGLNPTMVLVWFAKQEEKEGWIDGCVWWYSGQI